MNTNKNRICVQLRFSSKRDNTKKAEEYIRNCTALGYANRTEFVEDAVVEYYQNLSSRISPHFSETGAGIKTKECDMADAAKSELNKDYEDALRYFEEKRNRI